MKQKTSSSAWRYWPGYVLALGLFVMAIIFSPSNMSIVCFFSAFGVLLYIWEKKAREPRRNANNPDARTNAPQNGSVTPAKSASSASADNGRKFELPGTDRQLVRRHLLIPDGRARYRCAAGPVGPTRGNRNNGEQKIITGRFSPVHIRPDKER